MLAVADSKKVTRPLRIATPSILGRKQVFYLLHLREAPTCITFLVSMVFFGQNDLSARNKEGAEV